MTTQKYLESLLIFSFFICIQVSQAQIPDIVINEFLASNAHINYDLDYKQYSDWFELFNNENYDVNINGYYLTDDLTDPTKWRIDDDLTIKANDYFIFWADDEDTGIHTNFKINKSGEQIGIYMPDGSVVDEVTFNSQQPDIAYGRNPNNKVEWLYFANPTPGAINNTTGYLEIINCSLPTFSEGSGFYLIDLSLEITADQGAEIRYTIDGSEPDINSEKYIAPIPISDRSNEPNYFSEIPTNIDSSNWIPWSPPLSNVRKATIVRAKTFADGKMPSKIVTHSYFVGSELKNAFNGLPVISLISDEKHLFSYDSGIYVPGVTYTGQWMLGNYYTNWERPVHIEYFNEFGDINLSQEVDVKIQGSLSPVNPQKGLHIIASGKYDKSTLDYPFFKKGKTKANKLTSFKRFILRAWGNPTWNTGMIQDALGQTSYAFSSLDIQDYSLVVVFINGEYWGLQEIREANKNPYYFEGHYGIDKDNPGIDLLEGGTLKYEIDEGDDIHWKNIIDFISNNDLALIQNYEYIETQIDVDNFIDYAGHCIYFGKTDWPIQNEAFWRPKTLDGRWKWIQYDMDLCFHDNDYNMFNHVFNGTEFRPSHELLVKLIKNEHFKIKFINWFLDRIYSDFTPNKVIDNYWEILNEIFPYLDEHRSRWAITNSIFWISIVNMQEAIINKPDLIKSQLKSYFNLGNLFPLTIDRTSENGFVCINTINIDEKNHGFETNQYPWTGQYFEDIPIKVTAVPKQGFVFDRWEGSVKSQSDAISLSITDSTSLMAVFNSAKKISSLFINEILVKNSGINTDNVGDYDAWIELFNASDVDINLRDLFITDDISKLTKWELSEIDSFPLTILPGEYKVIWCDNELDEGQYHSGFALNTLDKFIGLTQITGNDTVFIDSVSFKDQLPNISYGRYPDASDKWEYLMKPTPGNGNTSKSISQDSLNTSQLFPNYPNPFYYFTKIPIYLTDTKDVRFDIFNINGNLIESLKNRYFKNGYTEILWDGKDSYGNSVPSGLYFYRLKANNNIQVKKMLLLK